MLFKLGIKNLKQNLLMNILTILQMSIVFVILISIISTIVSRFTYYTPFKTFMNSNGYYYNMINAINPETGVTLRTKDEICSMIEGEKDVIAEYDVFLDDIDNEQTNDTEKLHDKFISYDDEFAELFTPELESGHWFEVNSPTAETVPVVVTCNPYGLKTGDKIFLGLDGVGFNAEIIGIIKDNTKILDTSLRSHNSLDYRNLYRDYSFEREGRPTFIMLQKDLIDKPVIMQLNGNLLVTYDDSVTDEQIELNDQILKKVRVQYFDSAANMKKNSLSYIFSQIRTLIPIFISIFILTMVGAISTSALSAKKQIKNYAIFYVCGLKWKQCALINCWSSLICVSFSFVISLISTLVIKQTGLFGRTVIELGIWQIIGCVIVVLLYMTLSMILPLQIVGKSTPNQVLKSN